MMLFFKVHHHFALALLLLLVQSQQMIVDDISCNHAITTAEITVSSFEAMSGYGILFTVSSPYSSSSSNNEEMSISSLGFYVDTSKLNSINTVNYEVYTLPGYYADPQRTNGGNGGLPLNATWDHRGELSDWDKIAEGSFGKNDLITWPSNDWKSGKNYFQIPYNDFKSVTLPHKSSTSSEGGTEESVQSFYITLKEVGALLFAPSEVYEDLHDEQNVVYCGATRPVVSNNWGVTSNMATGDEGCVDGDSINTIKPAIHIGEGVVSYPFPSSSYFYQPRKFMGSIYYSNDCPTTISPSHTSSPSKMLATTHPPSTKPSAPPVPVPLPISSISTLSYIDRGIDGCHKDISTNREYESFKNDTSASYGIVFPIQSNEEDDNGVWITTLGFHVNFDDDNSDSTTVNYEVYALIEDGLYADPNRTSPAGPPETWDYRGSFDLWKKISSGSISQEDLNGDYFQLPVSSFHQMYVPPNGGVRSFYLTLVDSNAFVFASARKTQLGNVQKDDDYRNNDDTTEHPPQIRYGEGVIGYPFHTSQFLYSPKKFIGRVFYEFECPSQAPSSPPTYYPTLSLMPSTSQLPSFFPSSSPTFRPSDYPSASPSSSPTVFPR